MVEVQSKKIIKLLQTYWTVIFFTLNIPKEFKGIIKRKLQNNSSSKSEKKELKDFFINLFKMRNLITFYFIFPFFKES